MSSLVARTRLPVLVASGAVRRRDWRSMITPEAMVDEEM